MDEMSKSPEEIKKGLSVYTPEEIKEILQQKWTIHSHEKLYRSALAYIQQQERTIETLAEVNASVYKKHDSLAERVQQLEAQNAKLLEKIKQLEKERDAAIRDCARFPCYTCKERENGDFCPQCRTTGTFRALHEWRGPCEENGGLPELPKEDT